MLEPGAVGQKRGICEARAKLLAVIRPRVELTFVEKELDIMSFTVATTFTFSAAYAPGPGFSVVSARVLVFIALNGATL